jgi:Peptidase C13 family
VAVLGRSSIAAASMLPLLTILALAADYALRDTPLARWFGLLIAIVAAIYLFRAKHSAGNETTIGALVGSVAIVLITAWVYGATVMVRPQFWYSSDDGEEDALDWGGAEEQIYRQPELIDRALSSLQGQDPARADVYFVGFAGDGGQQVFTKEVHLARDALARRFDLGQHSLILANSPQPERDALLASSTALRRSLAGVASKMDVENDVLLLYITSHGSDEGSVAVSAAGMPFNDLYVDDLKAALQASGIRWRVLIVSACYSGTFIDPLKDDYTIIFTAARADRTSFGCSDERDLTYFGEALFREALPASSSLLDAFTRTQRIIAKREEEEGLDPSQPQIYVGEQIRAKLADLGFAHSR